MIHRASTSDLSLAVGAALLAVAVGITQVRLDDDWGKGVHLAVALIAAIGFLAAGAVARRAGDRPRAGASALLVAGLVLWAIADFRLIDLIAGGDDDPFCDSGAGLTAYFALLAAVAAAVAARSGSAACLLIAALAAGGTVVAGVYWLFDTENIASYRPVLVGLAVAFALAAFALRRRPRHRDVLVDAAGIALFALGYVSTGFFFFQATPDGWEVVLLVGGLALVAYAAATRAPGPGLAAIAVLLTFGVSATGTSEGEELAQAGDGTNLVGWPLVLPALGLAALAYGMLSRRRDTNHDPDRAVH